MPVIFTPAAPLTVYKQRKQSMKKKAHPGFKAVAAKVAKKQHIPVGQAKAIVAAGARKASKAAKKANPRLKRVKG